MNEQLIYKAAEDYANLHLGDSIDYEGAEHSLSQYDFVQGVRWALSQIETLKNNKRSTNPTKYKLEDLDERVRYIETVLNI